MEEEIILDLEQRLFRKMNYLIGVFSDCSGKKKEQSRKYLKEELKKLGWIEKSTTELDIRMLAKTNNLLESWIKTQRLW